MLRFFNEKDFFELALECVGDLPPANGDARVTVLLSSGDFSGGNDLWVDSTSIRAFCSGLLRLERTRKGEACLTSMSPGELALRIYATDGWGHVAVEGTTGYLRQTGEQSFQHLLTFGFEFDPSQLLEAIQVDWVRNLADNQDKVTLASR